MFLVKNNYIFGIPNPDLLIHYRPATFITIMIKGSLLLRFPIVKQFWWKVF